MLLNSSWSTNSFKSVLLIFASSQRDRFNQYFFLPCLNSRIDRVYINYWSGTPAIDTLYFCFVFLCEAFQCLHYKQTEVIFQGQGTRCQRLHLKHPSHPFMLCHFSIFFCQIECSSISEYSERIIKSNHLDSGKSCSSILMILHFSCSEGSNTWLQLWQTSWRNRRKDSGYTRGEEDRKTQGGHGCSTAFRMFHLWGGTCVYYSTLHLTGSFVFLCTHFLPTYVALKRRFYHNTPVNFKTNSLAVHLSSASSINQPVIHCAI